MKFSQRNNLVAKPEILSNSMDLKLRNDIWNIINEHLLYSLLSDDINRDGYHNNGMSYRTTLVLKDYQKQYILVVKIQRDFFHTQIDTINKYRAEAYNNIKVLFYKLTWYEVYDFIEFILDNSLLSGNISFIQSINTILENNNSTFRILGNKIITNLPKQELDEIKQILESKTILNTISKHIELSINNLFDRDNPDYRTSIKESISAVEALVFSISGKNNFKDGIKEIKKIIIVDHPQFFTSMHNLYNFTSDSKDGIRHSLKDSPQVDFEEAKYFLVVCSAFTNYLLKKAQDNNLTIK